MQARQNLCSHESRHPGLTAGERQMLQVATGRGPRISRPRSSACGNSLLIRIESSIKKKGRPSARRRVIRSAPRACFSWGIGVLTRASRSQLRQDRRRYIHSLTLLFTGITFNTRTADPPTTHTPSQQPVAPWAYPFTVKIFPNTDPDPTRHTRRHTSWKPRIIVTQAVDELDYDGV